MYDLLHALERELEFEADRFTFPDNGSRFQIKSQNRNPSTKLFPFNTVCFIRGRNGHFSGVLIAPRVVLTVKHGLFNIPTVDCPDVCGVRLSSAGIAASGEVAVVPGLDGSQPAGRMTTARPALIRAPAVAQFAHPRVDLGLIILPQAFRAPTRFMLLQPRSDAQTVNRVVTLAGYPGDMPVGTMWAHSDLVQRVSATHLFYRIDLCPGQSGGPVWLLGANGTRILLGIQGQQCQNNTPPGQTNCGDAIPGSPTFNCGARITCDVIHWIRGVCRLARVQQPAVDDPTFRRRCPAPAA